MMVDEIDDEHEDEGSYPVEAQQYAAQGFLPSRPLQNHRQQTDLQCCHS